VQPMKRLITLGVVALVVTGCGSDGNSAPPTSPVAVTSAATVATTTSTTTPATSTTVVAATTTTLQPETTTTVPTEDLIKQAVQDYFEAYEQCGTTPSACTPEVFTATQGLSRATVTEFAKGLVAQGLYFSTDRRGMYLVAESVSTVSLTEATANYCVYDAGIVMGPIGPDGLPTVVNDVIESVKYTYRLFLEDEVWKVGEQRQLERLGQGSVSLCPPAE
jgi:ABC-type glycerol-3-phosphate transport system substrate-binding protein